MNTSPYPGLRPFEYNESNIFFGRESQFNELITKLESSHFLAVVGLSGCGKTSLVRAGLLANADKCCQVAEMRPSLSPFIALAEALLKTEFGQAYMPDLKNRAEATSFLETELQALSSIGLQSFLQEISLATDTNLLVFVDQFEEIFSYYQDVDKEKAEKFVELLLASSQHSVYVILAMRSDFIGNCALFHGLAEAINKSIFLTPRLTAEQLREAIVAPARLFGGNIEETLVNQLLNYASNEVDQLPLLQHALMRMWHLAHAENPEKVIITAKYYQQIGGLKNALSLHADEAYTKLYPTQQKIAKVLFSRITEYCSTCSETRCPVKLEEVAKLADVSCKQVAKVVEIFRHEGQNFLTPQDKTLEPHTIIDISHETLIRQWQRLNKWTEEKIESVTTKNLNPVLEKKDDLELSQALELENSLHLLQKNTQTRSKRSEENMDFSIDLLEQTENEQLRTQVEIEAIQQNKLEQHKRDYWLQPINLILYIFMAVALILVAVTESQRQQAEKQIQVADKKNQQLELSMEIFYLQKSGTEAYNFANYPRALKKWQAGLKQAHEINDKYYISKFLHNIAMLYETIGQYQQALDYYQQALIIDHEIGDLKRESSDLNHISVIYRNLGQHKKALEYYQKALGIDHQIHDLHREGADLTNIGVVYTKLGQYQKALDYYQKSLAIDREIVDLKGIADNLINIGVVYTKLGQYQKALDYYQQALTIDRKIGDQGRESADLNKIGLMYYDLGQYQTALEYYQQALTIDRKIGNLSREGYGLTQIGAVYQNLGQYLEAKKSFQNSVSILESIKSDDLWLAQRGLAFNQAKLNQYEAAIEYYQQTLENLDSLHKELKDKEQKLSFMRNKISVYNEFFTLLQYLHQTQAQADYDRKALEVFERKQGHIFLEEMAQSGAQVFARLPRKILQRQSDLDIQIAKIHNNLVAERSKPSTGIKGQELQNSERINNLKQYEQILEAELKQLQQTIKIKYPDYYALKYPKPVKLNTLQKILDSDELMLVYGVMKDSTTLWLIGKNRFQIFNLPVSESMLKEKIALFRYWIGITDKKKQGFELSNRKYAEVKVKLNLLSNELYAELIPKKVRGLLTTEKTVYVIPTGPLYALPFETLVTKTSKGFKEAHYLIEDVPIAYLSSASLLKILRDAEKRRDNTAYYPLLAFANPVYNETKSFFTALPQTKDEAQEIAKILNEPNKSSLLQLGEAASVPTIKELNSQNRLDDYKYLLFGTHCIIPSEIEKINQLALVLSYPEKLGYLKMADILSLRFKAKLVALPACNIGNHKNERGEGVMGLTRAFMYAGTSAVALTLWSVESFSAKRLNIGFFRQLKNIQKPAAALRAIKLRMIRGAEGEKYKRLYYWAPLVVFGDAGL